MLLLLLWAMSPSPDLILSLSGEELRVKAAEGDELEVWFDVVRREDVGQRLPMLGSHTRGEGTLSFRPRFGFLNGYNYLARLGSSWFSFRLPDGPELAPTQVTAISPGGQLPANLLRLYVHFSRPMRAPEPYGHIQILDEQGRVIDQALVDVPQGLWDPARRRLTLLFHPGRIKRGVGVGERMGSILHAGKTYRVRVLGSMKDAGGEPLGKDHLFPLTIGTEDRESPDPANWRVHFPGEGSSAPIVVHFDEILDPGMLATVFRVAAGNGILVTKTTVAADSRSVSLTPRKPWPLNCRLQIHTSLEDPAGNNLLRPFDVEGTIEPGSDRHHWKTIGSR